jgi:hypothetical protein
MDEMRERGLHPDENFVERNGLEPIFEFLHVCHQLSAISHQVFYADG